MSRIKLLQQHLGQKPKHLDTICQSLNDWSSSSQVSANPLEKNSNQNFAPDTKRPSKKERRESTFFLVLLVAVKFHVLVNCISVIFRWRIRKARTSTYPCIYGIYDIYTYLILRLLSNKMGAVTK